MEIKDENILKQRLLRILRRKFDQAIVGCKNCTGLIEPVLLTNRARLTNFAQKFEKKIKEGVYKLSNAILKEIRFEIIKQLTKFFPRFSLVET